MNQDFDFNTIKNMSCENFFNYLLSLSTYELTTLATILGYLFSVNLDYNKQNSLGNFFELIGQILLLISAQSMTLQQDYPSKQDLQNQINELKIEIERLKSNH